MRRGAIILGGLAAAAALVVFEIASAGPEPGPRPSPPLPTTVLRGPPQTLATLRGRPALVNFWASWCEPCKQEAPELERFARSSAGSARLVGVDYTDEEDGARAFLRHYGWTFPVLSDPNGTAGARFGFTGLPTTVVLDARGRIVETLRGPQGVADLRAAAREAAAR